MITDDRARISQTLCPDTDPHRAGICRGDETSALTVFHYDNPGDTRDGTWYRAEDVIFLVDPVVQQNPLTLDGTTWPWSTGHVIDALSKDDRFRGVRLIRGTASKNIAHTRTFTIGDTTPKQRPGAIAEFYRWIDGNEIKVWEGLNPDKSDKLVDSITDSSTTQDWSRLVVFSAPGVYRVNLGVAWTYKSTSSVGRPGEEVSTTDTVTFVVGDVADLRVHDAGGHGTLPRGQRAYILRAENLLDTPVDQVQVALAGMPRGARAELSADGGAYAPGACNANGLCTGTWTIGALESRDARYNSGRSDGPTLTLLVDGDPAPLTATITSTRTRTVTVDGTTYPIAVTDLDASNSTNVRVATGTGRGEPDPEMPQDVRVERLGATALVRWAPVATVSQWPVAYYEVERNRQLLAVRPTAPLYLDLQAGGHPVYRVRAVSEAGVRGPWKISAAGLLPPPTPIGLTAVLITDSAVALTWAPSQEGGAVTGYTIQAADHAGGPYSTIARVGRDATRWVHTGLPASGATKYYRIRAQNRSQPSDWATASVELKTGDPPTGLRAQRYTTSQGNHAIQVWLGAYACAPDAADCWTISEYRAAGGAWLFGSQEQGGYSGYSIVPWGPDEPYYTSGDGRHRAIRLDTAYDIRVCQLSNDELETKLATDPPVPEGEWCRGEPSGRLRVPAGE